MGTNNFISPIPMNKIFFKKKILENFVTSFSFKQKFGTEKFFFSEKHEFLID